MAIPGDPTGPRALGDKPLSHPPPPRPESATAGLERTSRKGWASVRKLFSILSAVALAVAGLLQAPPAAAADAGAPSIQIVSPANGATISGDLLIVQTKVTNFNLNPVAIGTAAKAGEGHWHIYLDGKLAGASADGVVSVPNDAYPTLTAGAHTIKVELHNNDHTPVAGAQSDQITVNVPKTLTYAPSPGAPAIQIVSPTNGATIGEHVIVQARVNGFALNPVAIGTAAKAGEGHWHLYVDGKLAGLSASSVADVTLTPGQHTLKVELHNNDHTPVAGAQSDQITVDVSATAAAASATTLPKTGMPWEYPAAGVLLIVLGAVLVVKRRWRA